MRMCGRYFIDDQPSDEELSRIVADINRRVGSSCRTAGEIGPSQVAPVIANSRAGRARPFAMRWGFESAYDRRHCIFNARSETVDNRPMFKPSLLERRCLVPASGYFERTQQGSEQERYRFKLSGMPAMYMAGIYRYEHGNPVFTILTRAAGASVAAIHPRMPVILPRESLTDWLDPAKDALRVLGTAQLNVTACRA